MFLHSKICSKPGACFFLPGDDRLLTRLIQSAELVCSSEWKEVSVTESRFCKQQTDFFFINASIGVTGDSRGRDFAGVTLTL